MPGEYKTPIVIKDSAGKTVEHYLTVSTEVDGDHGAISEEFGSFAKPDYACSATLHEEHGHDGSTDYIVYVRVEQIEPSKTLIERRGRYTVSAQKAARAANGYVVIPVNYQAEGVTGNVREIQLFGKVTHYRPYEPKK